MQYAFWVVKLRILALLVDATSISLPIRPFLPDVAALFNHYNLHCSFSQMKSHSHSKSRWIRQVFSSWFLVRQANDPYIPFSLKPTSLWSYVRFRLLLEVRKFGNSPLIICFSRSQYAASQARAKEYSALLRYYIFSRALTILSWMPHFLSERRTKYKRATLCVPFIHLLGS